MKVFILLLVVLGIGPLHAVVFLEKPADFHPKAAVIGCCYLHYQDKILLLHRQDNKHEGNRWGIPGGKLNKNEPLIDAIVREVFEETGLKLDPKLVHYIGKLYIRVPNFDFEYNMVSYIPQIENPQDVKINFKEHKGFTWMTPQEALKMDLITDEDICFEITFGLKKPQQ